MGERGTRTKWMRALLEDLVPRCERQNIRFYDRERVEAVLKAQALCLVIDADYTQEIHALYQHWAALKLVGRSRLSNFLERNWPNKVAKKKRKRVKKRAHPASDYATTGTSLPLPTAALPPPPPPADVEMLPPPSPPPDAELLPPPPPPPPGESMGEILQQAWDENFSRQVGTPSPPERVGKTYARILSAPTEMPKRSFRCCLQVEVAPTADSAVVAQEMNRYLVEQSGFDVTVLEAQRVGDGRWWDFLIEYHVHLAKIRAWLVAHEFVLDVRAKPATDIGQVA